jgi:hypothetical protein
MNKSRVTLIAPTFLLMACSAATARSDVNPTMRAQISGWRSYAWLPEPRDTEPRDRERVLRDQLMRERIRRAVDLELSERGVRESASAPDFRIGWHAGPDGKLDVRAITDVYGYGWRVWYGPDAGTWRAEYAPGTLVLDFVDAGSNELAWRGVAQGRVKAASAAPTAEQVDAAVREILNEFPLRPLRGSVQ